MLINNGASKATQISDDDTRAFPELQRCQLPLVLPRYNCNYYLLGSVRKQQSPPINNRKQEKNRSAGRRRTIKRKYGIQHCVCYS